MINIIIAPTEKVNDMQEQMGNVSRDGNSKKANGSIRNQNP